MTNTRSGGGHRNRDGKSLRSSSVKVQTRSSKPSTSVTQNLEYMIAKSSSREVRGLLNTSSNVRKSGKSSRLTMAKKITTESLKAQRSLEPSSQQSYKPGEQKAATSPITAGLKDEGRTKNENEQKSLACGSRIVKGGSEQDAINNKRQADAEELKVENTLKERHISLSVPLHLSLDVDENEDSLVSAGDKDGIASGINIPETVSVSQDERSGSQHGSSREVRGSLNTSKYVRKLGKFSRLTMAKSVTTQSLKTQRSSEPSSQQSYKPGEQRAPMSPIAAGSEDEGRTKNENEQKSLACGSQITKGGSEQDAINSKRKADAEELKSENTLKKRHISLSVPLNLSLDVDENEVSLASAGDKDEIASGIHIPETVSVSRDERNGSQHGALLVEASEGVAFNLGEISQEGPDVAEFQASPKMDNGSLSSFVEDSKQGSCAAVLREQSFHGADDAEKLCMICTAPGNLMHCDGKGCNRSYHSSCMDPPLMAVPPAIWLCPYCVKKKLRFGVHTVAKAVESVWDATEGEQNGKHYFVKYKGFAHVHNHWMTEHQIIKEHLEGQEHLSKFKRNHRKMKRWNLEWTEPHRLLRKRAIMSQREADEFFRAPGDNLTYCNTEWLVKWKDLGYEHVTWELETLPVLCTSEARQLIEDFQNRQVKSQKACDLVKANQASLGWQSPLRKLLMLPDGVHSVLDDDDNLNCTNQLREFWCRSRHAILIDDQDRAIKTILFVMSLVSHTCRPFIILSSPASFSYWETKFKRWAPSINLVTYNGDREIRKFIRDIEFYGEGGSVLFQVLLSHPDAIFEDMHAIDCICWEAVIVDGYQTSRTLNQFESLEKIPSEFRLLLLSSFMKGSCTEFAYICSFVDPNFKGSLSVNSSEDFSDFHIWKEKLSDHIAYECKSSSSKFTEYWVPAQLSNVQLELYCSKLLSSSPALRSYLKVDNVGVLRSILIDLCKLCDHPYLIDQSLQQSLIKDCPPADILTIGVNASGKLLLLDKMLQEMRNRGLNAMIIYQSDAGAGRNLIGDILDDFLRQRFGPDTYERVERGLLVSKKQVAMNMFNDRTKGRFAFLIESSACLPSVKLSRVDAIIIYDSDWNPLNDVRTIQKMKIESQAEQIPLFRLYSCCTVEERLLIHAKLDTVIDSNVQNISPNISHSLLSWGAAFQFSRLDRMHQIGEPVLYSEADRQFINEIMAELMTMLPIRGVIGTVNSVFVAKALRSGAYYSRSISLIGEKEGISVHDDRASFWTNLLGRRYLRWLYISNLSNRSRRMAHNAKKVSEVGINDHVQEKQRKNNVSAGTSHVTQSGTENGNIYCKGDNLQNAKVLDGTSNPSIGEMWKEVEHEEEVKLQSDLRTLHLRIKLELIKLSDVLGLPDNVKCLTQTYLEYIINHHQVNQESEALLQAFNLSLCWRASSSLKHNMDRAESLALAAKKLDYECDVELVTSIYNKLRILKKISSSQIGEPSNQMPIKQMMNEHQKLEEKLSTLSDCCDTSKSEELGTVSVAECELLVSSCDSKPVFSSGGPVECKSSEASLVMDNGHTDISRCIGCSNVDWDLASTNNCSSDTNHAWHAKTDQGPSVRMPEQEARVVVMTTMMSQDTHLEATPNDMNISAEEISLAEVPVSTCGQTEFSGDHSASMQTTPENGVPSVGQLPDSQAAADSDQASDLSVSVASTQQGLPRLHSGLQPSSYMSVGEPGAATYATTGASQDTILEIVPNNVSMNAEALVDTHGQIEFSGNHPDCQATAALDLTPEVAVAVASTQLSLPSPHCCSHPPTSMSEGYCGLWSVAVTVKSHDSNSEGDPDGMKMNTEEISLEETPVSTCGQIEIFCNHPVAPLTPGQGVHCGLQSSTSMLEGDHGVLTVAVTTSQDTILEVVPDAMNMNTEDISLLETPDSTLGQRELCGHLEGVPDAMNMNTEEIPLEETPVSTCGQNEHFRNHPAPLITPGQGVYCGLQSSTSMLEWDLGVLTVAVTTSQDTHLEVVPDAMNMNTEDICLLETPASTCGQLELCGNLEGVPDAMNMSTEEIPLEETLVSTCGQVENFSNHPAPLITPGQGVHCGLQSSTSMLEGDRGALTVAVPTSQDTHLEVVPDAMNMNNEDICLLETPASTCGQLELSGNHPSSPPLTPGNGVHVGHLPESQAALTSDLIPDSSVDVASTQPSLPRLHNGLQPSTSMLVGFSGAMHQQNQDLMSIPSEMRSAPLQNISLPQRFSGAMPLYSDPLQNELVKIKVGVDILEKKHEQKMMLLQRELEAELEEVQKKYDTLLQEEDSVFLQNKKLTKELRDKLLSQQRLAEEFRLHVIEPSQKATAARAPQMQRKSQPSQPRVSLRPSSSVPRHSASPLPCTQSQGSTSNVTSRSLILPSVEAGRPPVPLGNEMPSGAVPSQLPPRPISHVRTDTRAPAPHLKRLGSQAHTSAGTSQSRSALIRNQSLLRAAAAFAVSSGSTQVPPLLSPAALLPSSSNAGSLSGPTSTLNPVPVVDAAPRGMPSASNADGGSGSCYPRVSEDQSHGTVPLLPRSSSAAEAHFAVSAALDNFISGSVAQGDN